MSGWVRRRGGPQGPARSPRTLVDHAKCITEQRYAVNNCLFLFCVLVFFLLLFCPHSQRSPTSLTRCKGEGIKGDGVGADVGTLARSAWLGQRNIQKETWLQLSMAQPTCRGLTSASVSDAVEAECRVRT